MNRVSNWKQLLRQCQTEGKEKVLARLEAYHKTLESMQVAFFAEPETVSKAVRMTPILLKQDETLIRLRQMTDDDIKKSLETGEVGVHSEPPL